MERIGLLEKLSQELSLNFVGGCKANILIEVELEGSFLVNLSGYRVVSLAWPGLPCQARI